MITLFFDTETTGKPKNYRAPVEDVDNWPRIVQIGWILCAENGTTLESHEFIVAPDGFEIPEEATAVHGISQEHALEVGISIDMAMMIFGNAVALADIVVGHNIEFDLNVAGAEFIRVLGRNPLNGMPSVCTMKSATNFCRLPSVNGKAGYKWPRLHELYFALFKTEMGEAHTALQDISNTAKCYFELKSKGVIK